MRPKDFMGTREIRQVQALLVRSDELARRGGPDDLAEVRLADSTPRLGEPATWGSGQRKSNRSWEAWAPFNGRTRPSMQREGSPAMATGLERIAAKARCEPKLRFTSLAHHITRERVWENLCEIPANSAPGVDRQTVAEAKESFGDWIEEMLQSVHRQGYRTPDIRRVFIPEARKAGATPARGALPSPTGPFSEASPRYSRPSTSRTFCHARLEVGPGVVPIMHWRRSMSGSREARWR